MLNILAVKYLSLWELYYIKSYWWMLLLRHAILCRREINMPEDNYFSDAIKSLCRCAHFKKHIILFWQHPHSWFCISLNYTIVETGFCLFGLLSLLLNNGCRFKQTIYIVYRLIKTHQTYHVVLDQFSHGPKYIYNLFKCIQLWVATVIHSKLI